jgi:hypothetical protein
MLILKQQLYQTHYIQTQIFELFCTSHIISILTLNWLELIASFRRSLPFEHSDWQKHIILPDCSE